MNIIIWLIIGGVVGWLASIVMRTDAQQGILLNVVVGIVGALLAGFIVSPMLGIGTINDGVSIATFLVSLVGAIILLAIVNLFCAWQIRRLANSAPPSKYVTLDAGTGTVHTAPGHGADDFETGDTQFISPQVTALFGGPRLAEIPAYATASRHTTWRLLPTPKALRILGRHDLFIIGGGGAHEDEQQRRRRRAGTRPP